MRQSQLFTKTRREAPKDEVAKNAELLIRGGFIHKELAGVYSYLPLGLRVLDKITSIVRQEMRELGAQELLLSSLQNPELWKKTDRWEQDVWFKSSLSSGGEAGFGWTQEEAITHIATQHVSSYRDLPKALYQIQTKFRNEERAKTGVLRGREFLMKDMYSFHADEASLDDFYERVKDAYTSIFGRVGLRERTFLTFASGGLFSKYSHEFQTLSPVGEDTVYLSRSKGVAINKEVLEDETLETLGVRREELEEHKAVEVGNIFKLGTRFSEPLGLRYVDEAGRNHPVIMGCYGLGPTRLLGTVVEALADEKGMVWPREIAPFTVHLIELSGGNADVENEARELYEELRREGFEVLYDDRAEVRAGEKFADADLIGIPLRVVVSQKSLAAGKFECIERASGKTAHYSTSELLRHLSSHA